MCELIESCKDKHAMLSNLGTYASWVQTES